MSLAASGARRSWEQVLAVVCAVVSAYAVILVIAPTVPDRLLFDPLGFGAADGGVDAPADSYVQFMTAVLGAVLLGWTVLLWVLARHLATDVVLWRAVTLSAVVWFIADTGMSLAAGYPTHAAFNLVFAMALGAPLFALRPSSAAP